MNIMKLAIFDVDGTLFDGNLGIDFVKTLIKNEVFSPEIGEGIFSYFTQYKNGSLEKSVAVDKIYSLYADGMKGNTVTCVSEIAMQTWQSVKKNLFPFAKELVYTLDRAGYEIILLSGSPTEMISILSEELGVKYAVGGTVEVLQDVYTGRVIAYPGSAEQKIEVLENLERTFGMPVDYAQSIAMGDNERDSLMLKKVGYGFAFEPNTALRVFAEQQGIHIVTRENVLTHMRAIITRS